MQLAIAICGKKQFLVFSDNRQKAAKFVSSFGDTYKDFFVNRLIVKIAEEHSGDLENGISFDTFVDYLANKMSEVGFYDEEAFIEWKLNDKNTELDRIKDRVLNQKTNASNDDFEQAYFEYWEAINAEQDKLSKKYKSKARLYLLNAMVGFSNRNSLMKKGGLYFSVKLNEENLANDDATLYQIMLQQFIKNRAVFTGEINEQISSTDYKAFMEKNGFNTNIRKGVKRDDSEWCNGGNGIGRNNRLVGFAKTLAHICSDEQTAIDVLTNKWGDFSQRYLCQQATDGRRIGRLQNGKVLNTGYVVIKKTPQLYKCNKCGLITPYNYQNNCHKASCTGHLEEYNGVNSQDDHYAWLYKELNPITLDIKEHTAQLSTDTAKEYQNRFSTKEGGLNVLSCTTTFEMGVNGAVDKLRF